RRGGERHPQREAHLRGDGPGRRARGDRGRRAHPWNRASLPWSVPHRLRIRRDRGSARRRGHGPRHGRGRTLLRGHPRRRDTAAARRDASQLRRADPGDRCGPRRGATAVRAPALALAPDGPRTGATAVNPHLSSVLEFAPPLVFAALGGVISERAGVVNIGLEGMMRFGAFAAAAGALFTGSPWTGVACGAAAGAAAAALHALLSLRFRADQVVSGIALNLVALGLVTFLLEAIFGSSGVSPPVPALPRNSSGQTAFAWLAIAAPFLVQLVLSRTPLGLRIRAVGERPRAAASLGVRVLPLRTACVLVSGAFAGIGGAILSVGILGQFDARMPAGQGFMALAAMVFGRWT